MGFRTIVAGAGMLAAFTLATTSSAPAETAGTTASASSSAHARAAKPQHRAVRKQREAAKARRSKRARLAARHRRQPADESADETVLRATAPVRETSPAARQQTAATRRFRAFLDPQSFALAVNEELRRPRLLAAHFSGEIADPEVAGADRTEPIAAAPHEETPPIVARDQTTGDDNPSPAPTLAHSDPVQVRAAPPEKAPERMSFLRWFFVAWGGVLTFASAVRMAVG
jgi:hypothetical protein